MTEQGRQVPEISNPVWLWQVPFLVDITVHKHFCNLKLQGANLVLMIHRYHQMKTFTFTWATCPL